MKRFRPSLWDDSEPDYAPFKKKIRDHYHWIPTPKYLDAGFSIRTYRLPGTVGDGEDLQRAAQCRALTRELLQWYEGQSTGKKPGTWSWLIGRYMCDEFSSFQFVRPNTRVQYRKELNKIELAIGNVLLAETDYTRLMKWQANMREKGRSVSYIAKWFRHWRLALTHGIKIEQADCARIDTIRSKMRIQAPAARQSFATRAQIEAIVAAADKKGANHIALSTLFRFEYMLRGVDVHGQWEPTEGRNGGVQINGLIWLDGLTWDMFEPDLQSFAKVISKTRRSLPEPYTFELTPDIRKRLGAIQRRTGPVIILKSGLPPREGVVSRGFKAIVRELKLPDDLRMADSRAGGITEAKSLVDQYTLRDAAQHTQSSTTDHYVRDRSAAANKVVQIRQKDK
jgi:hypothetical protein